MQMIQLVLLVVMNCNVVEAQCQLAITQLSNWFSANRLILNVNKTNFVVFNRRSLDLTDRLVIDGSSMVEAAEVKVLGLFIDSALKYETHILGLSKKLGSACYSLRCLRDLVSERILKQVYYGYFHSKMNYAIQFWGNATMSDTIFRVQKRCLRTIFGLAPTVSCRNYFRDSGIMTMISCYIYY